MRRRTLQSGQAEDTAESSVPLLRCGSGRKMADRRGGVGVGERRRVRAFQAVALAESRHVLRPIGFLCATYSVLLLVDNAVNGRTLLILTDMLSVFILMAMIILDRRGAGAAHGIEPTTYQLMGICLHLLCSLWKDVHTCGIFDIWITGLLGHVLVSAASALGTIAPGGAHVHSARDEAVARRMDRNSYIVPAALGVWVFVKTAEEAWPLGIFRWLSNAGLTHPDPAVCLAADHHFGTDWMVCTFCSRLLAVVLAVGAGRMFTYRIRRERDICAAIDALADGETKEVDRLTKAMPHGLRLALLRAASHAQPAAPPAVQPAAQPAVQPAVHASPPAPPASCRPPAPPAAPRPHAGRRTLSPRAPPDRAATPGDQSSGGAGDDPLSPFVALRTSRSLPTPQATTPVMFQCSMYQVSMTPEHANHHRRAAWPDDVHSGGGGSHQPPPEAEPARQSVPAATHHHDQPATGGPSQETVVASQTMEQPAEHQASQAVEHRDAIAAASQATGWAAEQGAHPQPAPDAAPLVEDAAAATAEQGAFPAEQGVFPAEQGVFPAGRDPEGSFPAEQGALAMEQSADAGAADEQGAETKCLNPHRFADFAFAGAPASSVAAAASTQPPPLQSPTGRRSSGAGTQSPPATSPPHPPVAAAVSAARSPQQMEQQLVLVEAPQQMELEEVQSVPMPTVRSKPPADNGNGRVRRRLPTDWDCVACGAVGFGLRTSCYKCGARRPPPRHLSMPPAPQQQLSQPPPMKEVWYQGVVKSCNATKGFGFIACDETRAKYQRDVWVKADYLHGCAVGEAVAFQVYVTPDGKPQASSLRVVPALPDLPARGGTHALPRA